MYACGCDQLVHYTRCVIEGQSLAESSASLGAAGPGRKPRRAVGSSRTPTRCSTPRRSPPTRCALEAVEFYSQSRGRLRRPRRLHYEPRIGVGPHVKTANLLLESKEPSGPDFG